ncbi:hypothetical protein HO173_008697 [Letharia columbiana]|uniref:Uncharacterized protein n=1 Tax=Letharia columbiana TaxID=112416 RepID=A0A8H6FR39_9LECA|nr:uncharacterized protein HO173_008697 [Letharia columbiana]KAF6233153.1 hypothetical protein HO173_008697 [Letharia columbiana]
MVPSHCQEGGTSRIDAVQKRILPDSEDGWIPRKRAEERIVSLTRYPDTTPAQDAMMIFCVPVMRRKKTKMLLREEHRTDIDKISRPGVVPAPVGIHGVYGRIGIFDTIPDRSGPGCGEEYWYREENEGLFTEKPIAHVAAISSNQSVLRTGKQNVSERTCQRTTILDSLKHRVHLPRKSNEAHPNTLLIPLNPETYPINRPINDSSPHP